MRSRYVAVFGALCALLPVLLCMPPAQAATPPAPAPPEIRMKLTGSDAAVMERSISRPLPPDELIEVGRQAELFRPAPDVWEWIQSVYLEEGAPLINYDHAHLIGADVGVLWTTAENVSQGRQIAGTAEIPNVKGTRWTKARERYQLNQWFGYIPDFVITLDAVTAADDPDLNFCALVDHELYHCGLRVDREGNVKYDRFGDPVFAIRGHDVEEHIGVVARYGIVSAGVERLVAAALRPPLIEQAQIEIACGNCLRA